MVVGEVDDGQVPMGDHSRGAAPWPFNFFHCWERSAPSPWIANGGLPHLDDDISLLVKKQQMTNGNVENNEKRNKDTKNTNHTQKLTVAKK